MFSLRACLLAFILVFVARESWAFNHPSSQVVRKSAMASSVVAKFQPLQVQAVRNVPSSLQMSAVAAPLPKQVDIASQTWSALPDIWDTLSKVIGSSTAVVDNIHGDKVELTYGELQLLQKRLAGALQQLGIKEGDCVSLFSENSHRWLLMEQAIMRAGACNAVRGVAAPTAELQYIYENSESRAVVVEEAGQLTALLGGNGLRSVHGAPAFACVLYPKGKSAAELKAELGLPAELNLITYDEMLGLLAPFTPVAVGEDARATLVYTSGTTAMPKGVVLRHRNLVHQVKNCSFNPKTKQFDPWVGDAFVSILPCWHIFERTSEYFCMSRGAKLIYSNLKNFKSDLVKHKPHFLIAVPRLFETIYKGVQGQFQSKGKVAQKLVAFFTAACMLHTKLKRRARGLVVRSVPVPALERALAWAAVAALTPVQMLGDMLVWKKIRDGLGGNIKCIVSGGSSLPGALEDFFEMIGERVVVGYGLTETSPVISNRVCEANLIGSVGKPPPGTTLRITDPETGKELPAGKAGVVMAKGPQIMSEYMNNPEATQKAIDKDGFFDTGDLGMINPATGDLIITGRAKDTIVLSNGENIAPQPIEDFLTGECKAVDQITLVGQDARFLGALVVVNPDELAARGLITKEDAQRMMKVLGPTPQSTGVQGSAEEVARETALLNSKPEIKDAVLKEIKKASKGAKFIKSWEVVSDAILLFEPFSIANGYLTQTLKVKRNVVADAFKKQIDALYGY